MHFHAEHSLFFETRRRLSTVVLSLVSVVTILVLNIFLGSVAFSLAAGGVGILSLLYAFYLGHSRIEPLVAWLIAIITCGLVGTAALQLDQDAFMSTGARIACGMVWILWLGTQVDWASLRKIFLIARIPEGVVASLDHALMHAVFTRSEWIRRRDTARLRQGNPALSPAVWGRVVGEGALHSFFRLEAVEENALLRTGHGVSQSRDALGVILESVNVERDGTPVLENLQLTLEPGEWIVLCGPSGAGKSSLLRLLAGLEAPTQGSMTRLSVVINPKSQLKHRLDGRVALMGQNPEHHFIASTVAEDIAWGLTQRGEGQEEANRKSLEMAKALRIDHLMDRPCHALSFGEQRRAALAGLLVLEPSLLLLDEPTAGLDPVAARSLRMMVETLARDKGIACVWATHDLQSTPSLAKRIVLLHEKSLLFDGPVDEGLSEPWLVKAGLALAKGDKESCC
ncbi:MAG: ABC transporter ATP-binding protein [Myxococcota bacterium]|nr:ABC transporter ATP-binding protein [Myxococcota bacterium]